MFKMLEKLLPRKDNTERREKRRKKEAKKRQNDEGYRGRRKSEFGVY